MNEKLLVNYVTINSIFDYKLNPKTHEEKQIQQIARSIERLDLIILF